MFSGSITPDTEVLFRSSLPHELRGRLKLINCNAYTVGRLGNSIVPVIDRIAGRAYLKIGRGRAGQDLLNECERLNWIGHRLPVPHLLFSEVQDDWTFMLISEVAGVPVHEAMEVTSKSTAIEMFASGLRIVHSLPIKDCPFDRVVERDLEESARRVGLPGLNESAFRADTGLAPSTLLDQLFRQAHSMVSLAVFTHGDYCFPNVILDNARVSGIVDWGLAGVCDINRDFMSAELTVKRNCGPEWVSYFYEVYGEVKPDSELTRFFWLLDRYFTHYTDPLPEHV